ncbi:MAG: hypothetical protein A2091_12030 [Desulfuromonadales bacterium GWD2_61_12]|nr:MAG: hypothetical protein A2005_09070 [Desulfuromonadales bacterium GWC2_61_20]OGR34769.1 MAG: hypothetical protein A2091_12030 [Desulfuromonadales bacterium GWD2_61_12]HAD04879.1 hypothetical protein [Desulfuromonas sp.]HBT83636.1 hypothetical protein [Desulfuromonas sp.]
MLRKISAAFAAGAVGAVVIAFFSWYLGDTGMLARVGINLHPAPTPEWLYGKVVWGGVWGGLFLLPLLVARPLLQGAVFSLAPSAAALFYFMPRGTLGLLGLHAGPYTPVYVLLLNVLWGVIAAFWYRLGSK